MTLNYSAVFASIEEGLLASPEVFKVSDPVAFLETFVYDPESGRLLVLEDEQKVAIRHLTRRDEDGNFLYSTLIYSAPKKSGKTTVSAGLILWHAWQVDRGQTYVIGNDLKQADNRLFRVIEYTVTHHPIMRRFASIKNYNIKLDNGTTIEALPIDPEGEAGAIPTAICFTEMWGFKGRKAELMWTELALSPTKKGQSFKLIETYAGHSGESVVLERLYYSVVKPEYLVDPERELYANPAAGIAAYWCTRRALSWQQDQRYYAQEEATKTPDEYRRHHHNEWVASTGAFVQPEWWYACEGPLLPYTGQPVVIGLDAAVTGDTFAVVGVTKAEDKIEARFVHVYEPPHGGALDFSVIESDLRQLLQTYNVLCVVYDPYQLHDLATRLSRDLSIWFEPFNQQTPRLKADKALYDRIRESRIVYEHQPILTAHVLQANAKTDSDKLRIIKRSDQLKIDAAVALSMAAFKASELSI